MNVKLVKIPFNFKDSKGNDKVGYNFGLKLENGTLIKIRANEYEDKKGVKHSNTAVLMALASEDLPF